MFQTTNQQLFRSNQLLYQMFWPWIPFYHRCNQHWIPLLGLTVFHAQNESWIVLLTTTFHSCWFYLSQYLWGCVKKNVKIRYPNWWIIDFSLAAIAICLKYPGRLLVTLPKLTISAASSEAPARCPSCWSSGDAGAGSGGSSPGASNGMWKHLEWQLQRSPIDRKNQRSKGLKLWICSSFCFHGSLPLPFFANTGHKLRRSFRPFTIGNRTEISITVPPSWCDWRETKGFFRVFSISDVATYGTRTSAPSPPQIVSKTNLSLCPTLAVHTQIWYCKFYPMIVPLNHHL